MARARNIKPGFFKNEELAECTPWARLCFAGLWTLADREGRLEDRPKRIKGELFAYDSIEVDVLLDELQEHGFILRYQVEDTRAIQILEFNKHQTPHYSEKRSVIKTPPLQEYSGKREGIKGHQLQENSEQLQEDSEKTPPIKRGSQPPDSLNPDSPNPSLLNPSLSPYGDCRQPAEKPPADDTGDDLTTGLPGIEDPPPVPSDAPDCPHTELLALYRKHLPELPQPRVWENGRAEAMRARWRQCAKPSTYSPGYRTKAEGLAFWEKFFAHVAHDTRLTKGFPRRDGPGVWQPDLPWLVKADNFAKVIEGAYS
jgi:hypothetical protein